MKKKMALLVAAMLGISLLSGCGSSGGSGQSGKEEAEPAPASEEYFVWEGDVITGLTEAGKKAELVTIPARCTGFGPDMSFTDTAVKSVSFEDDDDLNLGMVFMSVETLENIDLPKGLTKIGYMGFAGAGLKEIRIPSAVETIDSDAFANCKNLASITFEGTALTEIPECMCSNCESLKEISFPAGIVSVGDFAFEGCTSLEKVQFADSITTMGIGVFNLCTMKEFHFPEKMELTNADATAFGEFYLIDAYIYKDSWMDQNQNVWNNGFQNVFYES